MIRRREKGVEGGFGFFCVVAVVAGFPCLLFQSLFETQSLASTVLYLSTVFLLLCDG